MVRKGSVTALVPVFLVLMFFMVAGAFSMNILASGENSTNVSGTAFQTPHDNMQKQNSIVVTALGLVGLFLGLAVLIKAVSCLM